MVTARYMVVTARYRSFPLLARTESITFLHEHYQAMPSLQNITWDDVKTEYVCLVEYALRYFNTSEMNCLKLWSTLKQVPYRWLSAFLLVELCLCSPYSNATVERLFSQIKVVNRLEKLSEWKKLGGPAENQNIQHFLEWVLERICRRHFNGIG